MKIGGLHRMFQALLCIVFLQGTLVAQTPVAENTPQRRAEAALNLIHFGDLIDVDVVGSLEYDWRGTLNPEGFLDGLDMVEERIYALCRREDEVAKDIARVYGKILRDPKVVVKVLDRSNRPTSTVLGAVRQPQRFQLRRTVFLNELIVLAGGFTDKASGEIQVFRPRSLSCVERVPLKPDNTAGTRQPAERIISASQDSGSQFINIRISDLLGGKPEANIQILAGDIITIQEALPVYVIGGVTAPKQVATRAEITLTRAIASAGGLARDGDARKITIFRRTGGETKIIEADLEKIKAGLSADIVLQPYDVVEVARRGGTRSKYPPVIRTVDAGEKNLEKLPLRVID